MVPVDLKRSLLAERSQECLLLVPPDVQRNFAAGAPQQHELNGVVGLLSPQQQRLQHATVARSQDGCDELSAQAGQGHPHLRRVLQFLHLLLAGLGEVKHDVLHHRAQGLVRGVAHKGLLKGEHLQVAHEQEKRSDARKALKRLHLQQHQRVQNLDPTRDIVHLQLQELGVAQLRRLRRVVPVEVPDAAPDAAVLIVVLREVEAAEALAALAHEVVELLEDHLYQPEHASAQRFVPVPVDARVEVVRVDAEEVDGRVDGGQHRVQLFRYLVHILQRARKDAIPVLLRPLGSCGGTVLRGVRTGGRRCCSHRLYELVVLDLVDRTRKALVPLVVALQLLQHCQLFRERDLARRQLVELLVHALEVQAVRRLTQAQLPQPARTLLMQRHQLVEPPVGVEQQRVPALVQPRQACEHLRLHHLLVRRLELRRAQGVRSCAPACGGAPTFAIRLRRLGGAGSQHTRQVMEGADALPQH
ncbi:poly(beta-D-mannuronate) lyase [Babesia caballi]|uniref:Poly(Beta-D-mannuronate) lyase n=1 Tax=Babesia caballi TaxID=5871 RepID=A0AAV4M0Z3_BABCB|nr:poly(beta-D-mannuronate) lyase [Babesia caballi]